MGSVRRMVAVAAICGGMLSVGALAQAKPVDAKPVDAKTGDAKAGDLAVVLRQMDEGSVKFKSAQADFKKDLYERVVRETTTQTGSIYYQRVGAGIQMGAKFVAPAKTIEVKDGAIRMFDPGPNHLTEISIKSNQAQYESFLTLGFGGSGADLAKKWTISYIGTENLSDGKKTVAVAKLDLVAKDESTRNTFTHITIWIEPAQDVSFKQQFFQPSGDAQTVTYTNVRLNSLSKGDIAAFAIKTDKKTSVDRR